MEGLPIARLLEGAGMHLQLRGVEDARSGSRLLACQLRSAGSDAVAACLPPADLGGTPPTGCEAASGEACQCGRGAMWRRGGRTTPSASFCGICAGRALAHQAARRGGGVPCRVQMSGQASRWRRLGPAGTDATGVVRRAGQPVPRQVRRGHRHGNADRQRK
jgi:hypothetical protein